LYALIYKGIYIYIYISVNIILYNTTLDKIIKRLIKIEKKQKQINKDMIIR
jgi:hypothetical protein